MGAIRRFERGTTIIEVLVLLATGSLLVAVAVPGLSSGDRIQDRVVCADRLGNLAQAQAFYASSYDDWILGSPNTSGAYLVNQSAAWGPAVQVWDFMGPTTEFFGLDFVMASQASGLFEKIKLVKARFDQIRYSQVYHCPSNNFDALFFNGPNAGTGPMISYNSSRYQLFKEGFGGINGVTHFGGFSNLRLPVGYVPRVSRVGQASAKVWIADGARFSNRYTPPDYDLSCNASWGGTFADIGTYATGTFSWDRSRAPGNGYTGNFDPRIYAFRHADAEPPVGARPNVFKLNLAFYDGHVATQGDLESTNPHQWLPTGTLLQTSELWPDSRRLIQMTDSESESLVIH
jgi:prepilin-type processing-associated H-X9-DG protein